MFDHIKHLMEWITQACHVCDNKYYKLLIITYCDMQSKMALHKLSSQKNLNLVIVDNGVSNVNFKEFI